jgi:transcriptional/translational regulatory protein YebC/TACO1
MEAAIDAGAEDVTEEDGSIVVTTSMEDLHAVSQALSRVGLPVKSAELTRVPQTSVKVAGTDARTLLNLIEALDDLDDVSSVSANFDIDDRELAELDA